VYTETLTIQALILNVIQSVYTVRYYWVWWVC